MKHLYTCNVLAFSILALQPRCIKYDRADVMFWEKGAERRTLSSTGPFSIQNILD